MCDTPKKYLPSAETYSVHEFLLTVQKHSLLQALLGCHDYIDDPLMAALAPAKQVIPKLAPRYEALFSKQTAYYRMH